MHHFQQVTTDERPAAARIFIREARGCSMPKGLNTWRVAKPGELERMPMRDC